MPRIGLGALVIAAVVVLACARSGVGAPPDDDSERLEVVVKPERTTWGVRETITGSVTIKNIGTGRVRLERSWFENVVAMGEDGKVPPLIKSGIRSCAPESVPAEYLEPKQTREETFHLYTDPMHRMDGFELAPGKWLLSYRSELFSVIGKPVRVEVRAKENEYIGPRIVRAAGAGPNLVLVREGNLIEVVDAQTGKRLATRWPSNYRGKWMWKGSELVWSHDAAKIAYSNERTGPITVETLADANAKPVTIPVPSKYAASAGGLFPVRFSDDDRELYCATNDTWVVLEVGSGRLVRTAPVPEMWSEFSPDLVHVAAFSGSICRLVGMRGDDHYKVSIWDLTDATWSKTLTIRGHGEWPVVTMGRQGAYLADEFASTVYVPFDDAKERALETLKPADVVGETSDGALVALAWPGTMLTQAEEEPTTVDVWRVGDGTKACSIVTDGPHAVSLLSGPPRIICFPRKRAGDGVGHGMWLDERVRVYNAMTGELMKELDLTPAPGSIPDAPALHERQVR